ncbi:MAG: aminoacyl-histidine dipeptidase [Clostridia bacterium]|nr:aminoacyl-histidine dipeptidase [Clostridia bacterium]
MGNVLCGLKPEKVFTYFEELCAIPHGSYNEGAAADWVCAFAKEHGLAYRRDEMNNVLVRKAASAGYENEPVVMLQGHTDMVCVKSADSAHDFTRDPLKLIVKDGWISADGTTLGGDDGIAVAMMMAILDDDTLPHPELECLFTVQEEVGLGGAAGFDYSDIRAKLLYNLDSEDEGVGTASCAGGVRVDMRRPVTFEEVDAVTAKICVRGLKGGHSGAEIHMPRGNAHRIVGQMLASLAEITPIRLVSLSGGTMDNAIPRDCTAVIAYPAECAVAVSVALDTLCGEQMALLSRDDRAEGQITVSTTKSKVRAMRVSDTCAVLGILCLTPNGIATMCEDMPGLVESSCNMGILNTDDDAVNFGFLARASVEERKEELRVKLAMCAGLFGAEIAYSGEYPGWAYDRDSEAARRYVTAYKTLFGTEPRVEAIHAGLECGLMKHAVPGLDPISIGPDMKDIHTPDERISIASVERVYRTVCEMLAIRA